MIDNQTMCSITKFLLKTDQPDLSNFSLYNQWSLSENIIMKEKNDILTILNFIRDFNITNKNLIAIAYDRDTN